MVTYRQLWTASPAAWAGLAAGLRERARRLSGRAGELAGLAWRLGAGWAGSAGRAAHLRVSGLRGETAAQAAVLIGADQVLTEFAAGLVRAKALLAGAVEATRATPVAVDRDGRVMVTGTDAAALGDRTAAGIRAALSLASLADGEATTRLAELRVEVAPAPPCWVPPAGTAPATVGAWWAGLTAAERRWLLVHRPELLGSLDGVPVTVRDQANRALWAQLPGGETWWDRIGPPRAYLLRLDPAAGRVVIALGDPDRADHVLVHVPGAGSGRDTVDRDLARVDGVLHRAAALAPTAAVAGVLWLDYAAPSVPAAARTAPAHDAGPALDRFVDGLRHSHPSGAAHLTLLGHSYGSLVIGATARDHGLAADDVVFVGSPGVGVARAADLHLPADRIWSTTAPTDPVQYLLPSLAQAARDLVLSAVLPGYAPVAAATPDADLWHGHNPSRPDFGGRVFASADAAPVAAHTSYWDPGNVALDNIARITLGGHFRAGIR